MEVSCDLKGVDFEWFAVDRNGRLALFVTAGDGFVPASVAAAADAISTLSSTISTPHVGTGHVWEDYGNVGLYVYDWAMPVGPYGLIQSPLQALSPGFRQAILGLPALPKFDVEFGVTELVGMVDCVAA
ncbi:hypothetical protein [Lysobacter niastensis]|uniref:Uncharacterized protein n=1 Tax=Lysobacter niastensis TaxID=380629 RepID=A0ABS0B5E2_9GAMM|nr:hypothetical protein [Lysobacter niastensis]MBF6023963.1 hypothetical protein [Lysobacter niastensis]